MVPRNSLTLLSGGGATRPLPRDGGGEWRNSTEVQQFGHAPRSGPKVKN